jgi:hypothetical protein
MECANLAAAVAGSTTVKSIGAQTLSKLIVPQLDLSLSVKIENIATLFVIFLKADL